MIQLEHTGGTEMSKKISIELIGDDLRIESEGEFRFQETATILGNTTLHFMNEFLNAVPQEHREKTQELIFQHMNENFSRVLELFAPELELRPDLTTDAILKAENELLMSEMSDTSR